MNSLRILTLPLLICALGHGAIAQARSDPAEGRPVLGAEGVLLGYVEQVVIGKDGKPKQLLVRPKGKKLSGPHSLAYAGVDKTEAGFVTPLTWAEFEAMPAVELARDEP